MADTRHCFEPKMNHWGISPAEIHSKDHVVAAMALTAAPVVTQDDSSLDQVVTVNSRLGSLVGIKELSKVAVCITQSIFDSLIRRKFLADGSGITSEPAPGLT